MAVLVAFGFLVPLFLVPPFGFSLIIITFVVVVAILFCFGSRSFLRRGFMLIAFIVVVVVVLIILSSLLWLLFRWLR